MKNKVLNHLSRLFLVWLSAVPAISYGQPGGWSVSPALYQYGMTVVAQLQVGGVPNHLLNNHMAVFSHGQIRGYATPVESGGQAYYFMTLFSNQYKNDTLYFRVFRGADQKVYESVDTVVFKHQLALGTIGAPLQVHAALGSRPLIYTLSEVDYEENTCPVILNVEASDNLNAEGNGLTYSIVGGADAARFAIDPQTGQLSWYNFAPQLADPADADGDNRYEVEVKVTDAGGLFDVQQVSVRVIPALPPPPFVCPPNLSLNSSAGGTGDCGATSDQTAIPLPNACAASFLQYIIHGATTASGTGLIPANQLFGTGQSTAIYIRTAPGGGSECAFTVTVTDDEPPTITCPPSLTVSPTTTAPCGAVVTTGLNAAFSDNCSGSTLAYALSGATGGTGNGQAAGLSYPVGTTAITYTVTDGAGLHASCSFSLTVSNCNTAFSGAIRWEHDGASGVQNTTVSLTGSATGTATTNAAGTYQIAFPTYFTGNFTLKPTKNTNKLNGVTSADATAIQQHVANSTLLPAPFKRIAADVNKTNTITTLDVTLVNQALLGSTSALNQITSWRFVPAAYTFPNPGVPWGFPEQITLSGGGNFSGQDFKGIKLGDVVETWANPANFGAGQPLVLRAPNAVLQAGTELAAEFRADQLDDLASFQFALRFDPEQLQLLGIDPAPSALALTADHFGTFNLDGGEIRVVWAPEKSVRLFEATPLFRLRFMALQSGAHLGEVLALDVSGDSGLPGYSYTSELAESGVELRFVEPTGAGQPDTTPVWNLQVQPNPFAGHTTVAFALPADTDAELRVTDMAGRLLFSETKHYAAGQHRVGLALDGTSGVILVEMITPWNRVTQKLIAR